MTDPNDYRVKHLELIEGVISRQAQNSFAIKGWSVTLSAGIFTFLLTQDSSKSIPPLAYFIVLLPAFVFWQLDAYYLKRERLFRCLYDDVRREIKAEETHLFDGGLFDMDISPYIKKGEMGPKASFWHRAIFSLTVLMIPAMIIIVAGILYFYSVQGHP